MRILSFIAVLAIIAALADGCSKKIADSEVFDDSKYASAADVQESTLPPPPADSGAPGTPQTPPKDTGATPATPPPASGGDGKMGEMAMAFGRKLSDLENAAHSNDADALQKLANELRADFDKIKVIKALKAEASIADSADAINRKIDDLLVAISQADSNEITKCKNVVIMSWRPINSWMRANASASVEADTGAPGGEKKPEAGEEKPGDKPAGDKPKKSGSGWEDEGGDEAPPGGKAIPKDEKPEEE